MIPLPKYAQIANRYCIAYFGDNDGAILDLVKARPKIEQRFPDLELFICCNDEKQELIKGQPNIFLRSELKLNDVACFREITNIEDFLIESDII